MRNNTEDKTIERNYLQYYKHLIREYELTKAKKHPKFRFLEDFYKAYKTDRRIFGKYYHRYKQSGDDKDLLPSKRGPKWKSRRTIPYIEEKVKELRDKGLNRYEIVSILRPKLKSKTPSPSCVYNILKRHNLNRLQPKMKENKRKIIKEKAGELGHVDTHHLPQSLVIGEKKKRYIVGVIDSVTRIAWAELIYDLKALTVMFATMRCLNYMAEEFNIRFGEILSDNGSEFGSVNTKNKEGHPFERMLIEMGVKHRYIRPYRPQTNGKIERFWRTLEDDLLEKTTFESDDQLKNELLEYLVYYNYERPHQAINGQSPVHLNQNCQRIM